jgi:hypothetical protein
MIPVSSRRRVLALVALFGAVLAACSSDRRESAPPAALETPAMCEARYPPTQPECLVPAIYGTSADARQACVVKMQDYMQTIGAWRECHLAVVQNDAALSDHDRQAMIENTNFYADHDLRKAQANTACLQQGGGCEPY